MFDESLCPKTVSRREKNAMKIYYALCEQTIAWFESSVHERQYCFDHADMDYS